MKGITKSVDYSRLTTDGTSTYVKNRKYKWVRNKKEIVLKQCRFTEKTKL